MTSPLFGWVALLCVAAAAALLLFGDSRPRDHTAPDRRPRPAEAPGAPTAAVPGLPTIVATPGRGMRPTPGRQGSPRQARAAAARFAADWLDMLAGARLASQVRHAAPALVEQFAGSPAPGGPGRRILRRIRLIPAGDGRWAVSAGLAGGPPLRFLLLAHRHGGFRVSELRLD